MWKKAAITALVVVVLLAALAAVIHTSFFRQWILARVSGALSGPDTEFSASSLSYNLSSLRFTLEDVSYTAGRVEVQIGRALVDLPWGMLWGEPLRITELDVDGLRVRIGPERNGVADTGPAEPPGLPRFQIDHLRVRNGSFSMYREDQQPLEIQAFFVDVEGAAGTFAVAQPIAGLQPGLVVNLDPVPLRLGSDSVDFGPATWKIQHPRLTTHGAVEGALQWFPRIFLRTRWSSGPSNVMGWREVSTSGILTYSEGVVELEDLVAATIRGRLTGSVTLGQDRNSGSVAWTSVDLSPLNVPAETTGNLNLTWSNAEFTDAAGSGQVRLASRRYGRASSSVRIDGPRAILGVDATGFDAMVRADLVATMDQAISGAFRAEYPALNAVARGTLRGTFSAPRATASLVVGKAEFGGLPPLNATADIDANLQGISARNVVVEASESVARGQVSLVFNGMRLDGTFPDITARLEDFIRDASGSLALAATVSGSMNKPEAQFSASAVEPVEIRAVALETVELAGSLDGDILSIDRFHATQAPNQQVEGAGAFDIKTRVVSADLAVSDFRLDRFQDLDGIVTVRASVQGPYEKPQVVFQGTATGLVYRQEAIGDLTFDGAGEGLDVNFDAVSKQFSTAVEATVRAEAPYPFGAKVTAAEGLVTYHDYSATVDGALELAGQLQPFELSDLAAGNFRLQGEGVRLEASGRMSEQIHIAAIAELGQLPVDGVKLTGLATANFKLWGSLHEPLIEGRVSTENATIFSVGMRLPARIQAIADFNRNEIVIDTLRAEWGSAIARITGRSNIRGIGEYGFTIENLHLEELIADLPVSGAINLEGTARVNEPRLEGIEAEARFTTLDLVLSDVPVRQRGNTVFRLAKGVIEVANFAVEGGRTHLNIAGSANLAEPALNFTVAGTTDLEILETFIADTQIAGTAQTNIRIQGQLSDPEANGVIELADVQLRRQSSALIATDGSGTIEFQGQTIRLLRISAELNDGVVTAGGTVALSTGGIGKALLDIAGENVRWQYPDGLQAEVSTNLQLTGSRRDLLLGGEVRITQAVYGRDIDVAQEAFRRITSRPAPAAAGATPPSPLDAMRLGINVQIPGEVLVLNNLANLQLIGNFHLAGTVADPVVTGRLESLEGGEIYFGPSTGNSNVGTDAYVVDQGSIDLVNPRETEPIFNFVAHRQVRSSLGETYLVRLNVSGTVGDLKTNFTSDPPLSEPDIIALVLTGHTLQQASGRETTLARNQAIGYLSGVIQRSDLLESAGGALGLDTVRIDPFLVANETDIGARLTIGKDITPDLSLIFSQGLSGSQGQTWIAQYNAFRGFHLRGVNDSATQQVRAELRHQIDFGAPRPAGPRQLIETRRLGGVVFDQTSFPEWELHDLVTRPGKPFGAFQLQEDIEKLESFFIGRDYLNVQIRGTRLYRGDDTVDVIYRIHPGSRILLEYTGMSIPDSVQREIRETWNSGLFEEQALANARLRLMRYLVGERYFRPDLSVTRGDAADGAVLYTFVIDPGARFLLPEWVFRGAAPIEVQASPNEIVYSADVVRGRIENQYRSRGYIDVQVQGPALELKGQQAFYVVDVTPGPQYRIGGLVFNGNASLSGDHLRQAVGSASETSLPTDPWIRAASRAVESAYWRQGFNNVEVKTSIERATNAGVARIVFDIVEGSRQLIAQIAVEGDQRSDQRFIRGQVTFHAGDPVDYEKVNLTRKRLYDTGLFRSVDIDIEPLGSDNYLARIRVVENAPWRFRYGLAYTDKLNVNRRELGLSTDLSYSNLFGRGVTTGTSFRYDAAGREMRFFGGLPALIGHDIRTNVSVFGTHDLSDESFITDEIGFAVQQQLSMRKNLILSYDYNYRRNRTYERNLDPDDPFAFDVRIPIARFNASVTRDTRDDILNATHGTFLSNSFELAPPGVGSGIHFTKNYTQFFSFRPVKEGFTWASALRVGLANAFGREQLIPSERFAAGGSTTVRGFKQNDLTPERGNAAFILNQELRFPVVRWFSGAAFIDLGNIYPTAADFNPFKLRYSPGAGLRVQTPLILIRFDAGFNLGRRPGEDPYRFSFGIGQAF